MRWQAAIGIIECRDLCKHAAVSKQIDAVLDPVGNAVMLGTSPGFGPTLMAQPDRMTTSQRG